MYTCGCYMPRIYASVYNEHNQILWCYSACSVLEQMRNDGSVYMSDGGDSIARYMIQAIDDNIGSLCFQIVYNCNEQQCYIHQFMFTLKRSFIQHRMPTNNSHHLSHPHIPTNVPHTLKPSYSPSTCLASSSTSIGIKSQFCIDNVTGSRIPKTPSHVSTKTEPKCRSIFMPINRTNHLKGVVSHIQRNVKNRPEWRSVMSDDDIASLNQPHDFVF